MPVFHTKTIESILEPVAQQVSRLVILHEDAEDGNAMPNLSKPVLAVSQAVANLVRVGRETIKSSDDEILRQDMPASLNRVESASQMLEEASNMLNRDPYSQAARKKLIEGSRGILQGTSGLLLCFDESEVRKIVQIAKKVLDYLAVAEVVDTMEDLVCFVQDLSPCLSRVSRDVKNRQEELTHQVHRNMLTRCLEELKTLTPILVCSMKIFIQIHMDGGKSVEEADINRSYIVQRMSDEIHEIIRILQLTTYGEDEWEADTVNVMRRAITTIENKVQSAKDWLRDPRALCGGVGEKAVRGIIQSALKVSENCLPQERETIRKMCDDLKSLTDVLVELRDNGQGTSPQAESVASGIEKKLNELQGTVLRAVTNAEKAGILQPAHTNSGRLEQARRWLADPASDDVGKQAAALIIEEARRVAKNLSGVEKAELNSLSDQIESLLHRGNLNGQQAQFVAGKLAELKNKIQNAVVNQVLENFMDTVTPLKQFAEAVAVPEGVLDRDLNFAKKSSALLQFSNAVVNTGRSTAGAFGDKNLAEALLSASSQVESLTPQLVSAGRILMSYPGNKAAIEHFENLKAQYSENIKKVRLLCDDAIDKSIFFEQSEKALKETTQFCEDAINSQQQSEFVNGASKIARICNRVLMVAKQEAENSEDVNFNNDVNNAADKLQDAIPAMVQAAKGVAQSITDPWACNKWRDLNNELSNAVGGIRKAVVVQPYQSYSSLPADMSGMYISDRAPQRPPPPSNEPPPRPPPPETDDEDEHMFVHPPKLNQPIMIAAHGLHQEVRQWSSQDNDIVKAAKRCALSMARLSQLVRGEGGNKKDLIACAKQISTYSEEVTLLAKELARDCTDKRMRMNLLQVCERIPTIGTQLKILSTVKATMLGAQGTEEDREATEMLVGNAQNLMQSVKETVRAAEAASIKMRTDAGVRMRWVRKQPWYQY